MRIEEVPAPSAPGPLQAIVSPLWSGICGTDIKEYTGHGTSDYAARHPLTGYEGRPLILGHEFSARVEEIGAEIENVKVGDEVAVYPLLHCGKCEACLRGEYQNCRIKAWNGLSSPWGGFGEKVLVEHYQLTPLNGIPASTGALIEPAAVALNAAQKAGVSAGDTVFIAGAGAIGVLSLLAARALGAAQVHVFELNPKRAALVGKFGGTVIPADAASDIPGYLRNITGGLGVDVAIDAAGKPAANATALESVKPGGTLAVPAVHLEAVTFDIRRITRADLTMVGSVGYTRHAWDATVAMVRSGAYPIDGVATAKIPLTEIVARGFEVLSQPSDELKVLVQVNE
ncbi:zinc-binding dehydrogenase [Gryllotalpicola reticulitermitis]|uniref:Zinc-binding dehydrogenase n=1 Tax=Gryllotalpicola reticulitermitis TaxID=1184153 RepID=A0ABV8Q122_9MICO